MSAGPMTSVIISVRQDSIETRGEYYSRFLETTFPESTPFIESDALFSAVLFGESVFAG